MKKEKVNRDEFKITYLFNNHLFGLDQDPETLTEYSVYTQAVEGAYVKSLTNNFNLVFPLSFGGNRYPDANDNLPDSDELYLGLDAIGQLLITGRQYLLSPYVFGGIGGEYNPYLSDENLAANIPFGVGLDFNVHPDASFGVRGGYRYGINTADYLQLAASFIIRLGESDDMQKNEVAALLADMDGDGINDNEDDCPSEPGTYAFNGCPDTDGDGVADKDDKCPTVFGEIELDGCAKVDTDGDGVADSDDACPDVVGTPAAGGCPDADGDGLADEKDLCPNEYGTVQTNGCPDSDGDGFPDNDDLCPNVVGNVRGCPDSDLDGISDDKDRCPNEAGVASNGGCPAVVTTTTTTTTTPSTTTTTSSGTIVDETAVNDIFSRAKGQVEFETSSARLKSSSRPVLDEIASLLRQYPGHNMKIGGHTDSIGDSASNQRLSEKRAKACYEYLVKNGISGSRLSYKGFGEKQPIATNKYKDGRKKNRRVEFELWKP